MEPNARLSISSVMRLQWICAACLILQANVLADTEILNFRLPLPPIDVSVREPFLKLVNLPVRICPLISPQHPGRRSLESQRQPARRAARSP